MTKTELKENITKINKLLRSDSYEIGIELIKTFDDPEITKGTLKEVLKLKRIEEEQRLEKQKAEEEGFFDRVSD